MLCKMENFCSFHVCSVGNNLNEMDKNFLFCCCPMINDLYLCMHKDTEEKHTSYRVLLTI